VSARNGNYVEEAFYSLTEKLVSIRMIQEQKEQYMKMRTMNSFKLRGIQASMVTRDEMRVEDTCCQAQVKSCCN
jgi:hypothetical protein